MRRPRRSPLPRPPVRPTRRETEWPGSIDMVAVRILLRLEFARWPLIVRFRFPDGTESHRLPTIPAIRFASLRPGTPSTSPAPSLATQRLPPTRPAAALCAAPSPPPPWRPWPPGSLALPLKFGSRGCPCPCQPRIGALTGDSGAWALRAPLDGVPGGSRAQAPEARQARRRRSRATRQGAESHAPGPGPPRGPPASRRAGRGGPPGHPAGLVFTGGAQPRPAQALVRGCGTMKSRRPAPRFQGDRPPEDPRRPPSR